MSVKIVVLSNMTSVCENGKYLKSIVDDSKIMCGEIIYDLDISSTNVTNTIAPSTISINHDILRLIISTT